VVFGVDGAWVVSESVPRGATDGAVWLSAASGVGDQRMIRLTFGCGHAGAADEKADSAPVCAVCGCRTVAMVQARPPRFRGVASGPYCETVALPAAVVDVAPGGPLVLKG
jgi:hypothetical protein